METTTEEPTRLSSTTTTKQVEPERAEIGRTITVKAEALYPDQDLDGPMDPDVVQVRLVAKYITEVADREAGYQDRTTQYLVERSGRLHTVYRHEVHVFGEKW